MKYILLTLLFFAQMLNASTDTTLLQTVRTEDGVWKRYSLVWKSEEKKIREITAYGNQMNDTKHEWLNDSVQVLASTVLRLSMLSKRNFTSVATRNNRRYYQFFDQTEADDTCHCFLNLLNYNELKCVYQCALDTLAEYKLIKYYSGDKRLDSIYKVAKEDTTLYYKYTFNSSGKTAQEISICDTITNWYENDSLLVKKELNYSCDNFKYNITYSYTDTSVTQYANQKDSLPKCVSLLIKEGSKKRYETSYLKNNKTIIRYYDSSNRIVKKETRLYGTVVETYDYRYINQERNNKVVIYKNGEPKIEEETRELPNSIKVD